MKIYSIEEIVEATNNILNPSQIDKQSLKKERTTEKESFTKPLVLKNEILLETKEKVQNLNKKIEIKDEMKNDMINEIYGLLKKKVKRHTLKLIIEEQLEIKNLKKEIEFLKKDKNELIDNLKELEKKYNLIHLSYENLKIENQELQNNLYLAISEKEKIIKENKLLKENDKQKKLELNNLNEKNRSFQINNAELKNTVSRYIVNTKKIQDKLNNLEKSKNLILDEKNKKLEFYQEENIRLSSELISSRRKNDNIKTNLADIEIEKQKISNKIKELNKSIEEKTNVFSTNFPKEKPRVVEKNIKDLTDREQKSLDEVISRIFKKL